MQKKRQIANTGISYNDEDSILGYSNFSYEVLLTQMINRVEKSLDTLGIEPEEIALETLKGIFIFL